MIQTCTTVILNVYCNFPFIIRVKYPWKLMEVLVTWKSLLKNRCLTCCFITNIAEGFTLWYLGFQIKCQIQFATENMKCVTALRGVTSQHNSVIGVCPKLSSPSQTNHYLACGTPYSFKNKQSILRSFLKNLCL